MPVFVWDELTGRVLKGCFGKQEAGQLAAITRSKALLGRVGFYSPAVFGMVTL